MPRSHAPESFRPIEIQTRYLELQPASVLYRTGGTRVLCVATLEQGVPPFLQGTAKGWATAEYDLLPGATSPRRSRERSGHLSGRTQEIQRFIGRSLRAVLRLDGLTGVTLRLDCDVLEADGGTRTASINGGYLAARMAVATAVRNGVLTTSPFSGELAAVSVGIVDGAFLLDLSYEEDHVAAVDLNVVVDGEGRYVEIQGASEGSPFTRGDLDRLLDLAETGARQILEVHRRTLAATRGDDNAR